MKIKVEFETDKQEEIVKVGMFMSQFHKDETPEVKHVYQILSDSLSKPSEPDNENANPAVINVVSTGLSKTKELSPKPALLLKIENLLGRLTLPMN